MNPGWLLAPPPHACLICRAPARGFAGWLESCHLLKMEREERETFHALNLPAPQASNGVGGNQKALQRVKQRGQSRGAGRRWRLHPQGNLIRGTCVWDVLVWGGDGDGELGFQRNSDTSGSPVRVGWEKELWVPTTSCWRTWGWWGWAGRWLTPIPRSSGAVGLLVSLIRCFWWWGASGVAERGGCWLFCGCFGGCCQQPRRWRSAAALGGGSRGAGSPGAGSLFPRKIKIKGN